jgi:actin-related protein
MNLSTTAGVCIGASVYKKAARLSIRYPVENHMITDLDDFQLFLTQLFLDELHVTIENYPLLMTLTMLSPEFVREIAMETFRVPPFYCASRAAMALCAAGVTSGIIVDSGDTGMVVHAGCHFSYYAARLTLELAT